MSIGSAISGAYNSWVNDASQRGVPYDKPTPFEPGSVTGGAELLKLATGIAAARRSRGNMEYAIQQKDAADQEAHQKTLADIAHTNAETSYLGAQSELAARKAPEEALYDIPVKLPDGTTVNVKAKAGDIMRRSTAMAGLDALSRYRASMIDVNKARAAHIRATPTSNPRSGPEYQAAVQDLKITDSYVAQEAARRADEQMKNDVGRLTARGNVNMSIGGRMVPVNDDQRAYQLGMTKDQMNAIRQDPKLLDQWQKQRRDAIVKQNMDALYADPRVRARRQEAAKRIRALAQLDTTQSGDIFEQPAGDAATGADPLMQAMQGLHDYLQSP